jgi:hypothetical protein
MLCSLTLKSLKEAEAKLYDTICIYMPDFTRKFQPDSDQSNCKQTRERIDRERECLAMSHTSRNSAPDPDQICVRKLTRQVLTARR